MKRTLKLAGMTALIAAVATIALAQPRRATRDRMYDPNTVETVSGTVERIYEEDGRGGGVGLHVDLKTEKGVVPVHLGPVWYMEKQPLKIQRGDQIEVKGSRVEIKGDEALIAAVITKDGNTLSLRDKDGVPNWAGQGQGPGSREGRGRGTGHRWRHGQVN